VTDHEKDRRDEDLPGPADDPEGSEIGSTDERSSANRREGLRKDREPQGEDARDAT
jgi:hypothetical protein